MATRIDGLETSKTIKGELKERVDRLKEQGGACGLGTILVGDDPASHAYVGGKRRDCAEVGIESINVDLPADATQEDVENAVKQLNEDPKCTGYIVQLPLPQGLDQTPVLEMIDPEKDADGLHPTNLGKVVSRVNNEITSPIPCTPNAVVELLKRYDINTEGKNVVIIGRSMLVGRPLGMLMNRRAVNATVTMCHTKTKNLADVTRAADIVIAAAGAPGVVTADMIGEGAVVIDVGINRVDDPEAKKGYRLVGDVEAAAEEKASYFTPVPGGVGPMTRTMLLANVVGTAERQAAARG